MMVDYGNLKLRTLKGLIELFDHEFKVDRAQTRCPVRDDVPGVSLALNVDQDSG